MNNISNLKNRFIVMYSGVLGLGYDFDVVLRSAKLLEKNVNITFIIRGTGELALKLKKDIRLLDLDNVVLDTKFLSKDELSTLLNSADVFLLPMADLSFVDLGLPTKVFEYQSYGKPIICVSNGEAAKYVKFTCSGIVVNPKDATGLAQAILSLYEDTELVNSLGINGKECVSEKFTSEKIGERMYTLFSSLVYSTKINES